MSCSCCTGAITGLTDSAIHLVNPTVTLAKACDSYYIKCDVVHDTTSRVINFLTSLEISGKKWGGFVGVLCLFDNSIKTRVHPDVYNSLKCARHAFHFFEHIIQGISILGDVLRYRNGDVWEYKADDKRNEEKVINGNISPMPQLTPSTCGGCVNHPVNVREVQQPSQTFQDPNKSPINAPKDRIIDYPLTVGRILLAVSHVFASIEMFKVLKLMNSTYFDLILKRKTLLNIAGGICLFISTYQAKEQDSKSTEKKRIYGTGLLLNTLPYTKKINSLAKFSDSISKFTTFTGIVHAYLVHSFSANNSSMTVQMSNEDLDKIIIAKQELNVEL